MLPWAEFWGSGGQWLTCSPASVLAQLGRHGLCLVLFVMTAFPKKMMIKFGSALRSAVSAGCVNSQGRRSPQVSEQWKKLAGLEAWRGLMGGDCDGGG